MIKLNFHLRRRGEPVVDAVHAKLGELAGTQIPGTEPREGFFARRRRLRAQTKEMNKAAAESYASGAREKLGRS